MNKQIYYFLMKAADGKPDNLKGCSRQYLQLLKNGNGSITLGKLREICFENGIEPVLTLKNKKSTTTIKF